MRMNTPLSHTQPSIAFLGMGLMGSRMSARLLNAGFDVSVWNRTPCACQALYALGAKAMDIHHDVSNFDIIMLCLADDDAVDAVVEQFFAQLQPHQIIIDFSSLSVEVTQQLAAQVAHKGAHWVDAPVSGGVMGAEQGSLVIFAGGDPAIIASLENVFKPLSQRVTHMGANGTGQATKICNQLIVAASSTLISEAVALAARAGVDTHLLAPALAGGFADSKPFQILAPRMASSSFHPVQWKVQTLSKDLGNALALAALHQLDIPVATKALQRLQQHQANGHAEDDLSSIILLSQSAKP
jgi:3-hydroxyisobutyrate dehydrogenase